jgi:hypothetical protein
LGATLTLPYNIVIDKTIPISKRVNSLYETDPVEKGRTAPLSVTLAADLRLADRLPTDAPLAVLWAPRMLVFPAVSEREDRRRFLLQLYYLGFDEKKLKAELDRFDWNFYSGLFPYDRLSPVISGQANPISGAELQEQVSNYLDYAASFTKEQAASPVLSYVVVSADNPPDFSNLDSWYTRDAGERIGDSVLYRVTLRR